MNIAIKYFIITGIILISNSVSASQSAAESNTAAKSQTKSEAEVLANAQQASAAGSSGAAASASAPIFEYNAETIVTRTLTSIIKRNVIKRASTGEELEEIIEFSTTPYVKNPFEQIPSVKIVGSRALYPALSLYKEGLLLYRCRKLTEHVVTRNCAIDMSEFIHGPSNATFNLNNQTKNEQA